MFKNRKALAIILSIILLVLNINGFAYYEYTQESGTNFFVNVSDGSDALEDTNEVRQILDDLGNLLDHSKRDDSYPKDLTTGGTLGVFDDYYDSGEIDAFDYTDSGELVTALVDYYLKTAIDSLSEVETIYAKDITDSTELAAALADYYLKTAIDTLGEVETIYVADITDSYELATALGDYYPKTEIDSLSEVEAIYNKDIIDSTELASDLASYYLKTAIDSIGEMETIWGKNITDSNELASALTDYYLKTAIDELSEVETIYGKDIIDSTELEAFDYIDSGELDALDYTDSGELVTALADYQPLDTALTNISALSYVSPSFIKLTADDSYEVRTLAETLTDVGASALQGVEAIGAVTFNDATHILSVATITYWFNGATYTTANPTTCDIDSFETLTDNTLYYFYFDDATGTLKCSDTDWNFTTQVMVATVFWNGTNGAIQKEWHNHTKNIAWHKWAHDTIGARYEAGLSLTAPTTAADATLTIASGSVRDEDLLITISQQSTSRIVYKASASIYTWVDSSLPYAGSSADPKWLDTDNYTLTSVGNSDFVSMWVYATNDADRHIYIIPTHAADAHNIIAQARAETAPVLSDLNLNPEMKLIYRFIYKGDGQFQESNDYRLTSPLPSGGSASTNASAVSFSPSGNIAATTVQTALEEVDAEKAKIGANSDITSMTGLTTPLGAAYGGTGVVNAAGETITLTGGFALNLILTGATEVILPDSGTVATIAEVPTDLTDFVEQTAWRVFYSDSNGDVTELALGNDGQYLKSNGATSAPTFETPAGAGDMLKATYDANTDDIIDAAAGGTGVANAATETITLAGDDPITFTTTNTTDVTLPTTGTLLANLEEDTDPDLGGQLQAGTHSINFTEQVLTSGTAIAWDLGNSNKAILTAAHNFTITITAPSGALNAQVIITQDGTGTRVMDEIITQADTAIATTDVNTTTEEITVTVDIPTGARIRFKSTTAVPAGLVADTIYYAIRISATVIKVATTKALAHAGTAINLTDQGTGTHTVQQLVKWTGGTLGVLTTDAGAEDILALTYKTADKQWYAILSNDFY